MSDKLYDVVMIMFNDQPRFACARCGKPCGPSNDSEAIDAELAYRASFPRSWWRQPKEMVCDECFLKMAQIQDPRDFEDDDYEEQTA